MDPLLQMMAGRESAEPGDSGTGAQACALPLRDRLNLLQSCTLETMKHAWEWVFENAPAYNRTHIYDELLAGASVSLALPLQHLTARLVCLLFAVQVRSPALAPPAPACAPAALWQARPVRRRLVGAAGQAGDGCMGKAATGRLRAAWRCS